MTRTEKIALALGALLSLLLLFGATTKHVPLSLTEVLGFITGAIGVYLTVKCSVWNFPVGLANNLFFGVLFFQSRLWSDTGLQILFFVLGAWGWAFWTRSQRKTMVLPIGRASWKEWLGCGIFIVLATACLTTIAAYWNGASPFWDALSTTLSLAAQYLLGRKFLENWVFWLLADIIYVPLYFSRGLQLTGALYFGFGCLCVMGFLRWKAEWKAQNSNHETLEDGRDHRQIPAAASGP